MWKFWTLALAFIILTLNGALLRSVVNGQPTVTPTNKVKSLFLEDICAPPCWFGLTPGESTAQDVAAFMENADEQMFARWNIHPGQVTDPDTGYLIQGQYNFYWRDFVQQSNTIQGNSMLYIDNGLLEDISVYMNEFVSLAQTLENLGEPDFIHYYTWIYGTPYMLLSYKDLRVSVRLTAAVKDCTFEEMSERFWVNYLYYFSPRIAEELDLSQLNVGGPEVPRVSPELWEQWLNNEVNSSCRDVSEQLIATQTAATPPAITPTPG